MKLRLINETTFADDAERIALVQMRLTSPATGLAGVKNETPHALFCVLLNVDIDFVWIDFGRRPTADICRQL